MARVKEMVRQPSLVIGWDVECRLCGLEAKGLALKQSAARDTALF